MESKKVIHYMLVLLCLLGLWWLLTLVQTEQEKLLFPSPSAVLNACMRQPGDIVSYSMVTWYRVVVGLVVGGGLGFIAGIFMNYSKIISAIFDPLIELIRPIPPVALTPFFILWFGLSDFSQMFLISLGCFMIICVSVYEAARNVNPIYIRSAQSLGADTFTIYKTVIVPAVIPSLLSSFRVALASSFALAVAAEYMGAQGGLGYLIRNARTVLQTDTILLAALILGGESLVSDFMIRQLFGRITRWMPNR